MSLSFVAQILVWTSIYYFTFEILLIKTSLQNKDTVKRKRVILITKFAMIALMITVGALALSGNVNYFEADTKA